MRTAKKTSLIFNVFNSTNTIPTYSFSESKEIWIKVEDIAEVYGFVKDELVSSLSGVTYKEFFISGEEENFITTTAYNMSILILVIRDKIKEYSVAACDVCRHATSAELGL